MITYYSGEYKELADLFTRSVHELASQEYTFEQLCAWACEPVDYLYWKYRCELKRPFLYKVDESVAGFIELDPDGHIDCHYVHPNFTRQGIGTALLLHVMDIAQHLSLPRLYVEASHLIKPLYLKQGFICLSANQVIRNGVPLENWIMEKNLASP